MGREPKKPPRVIDAANDLRIILDGKKYAVLDRRKRELYRCESLDLAERFAAGCTLGVNYSRPIDAKLQDIALQLIASVERLGGVRDGANAYHVIGHATTVDLANAYLAACEALSWPALVDGSRDP